MADASHSPLIPIQPDEPVGSALRRITLAELDQALAYLGNDGDPDLSVHEARKSIKRVRAILRLLRVALGKRADKVNGQLRATAGMLGPLREATAARESLQELSERAPPALAERFASALVHWNSEPSPSAVVRALFLHARTELSHTRSEVETWQLVQPGFDWIERDFRRGIKKAQTTLKAAKEVRTAHAFHELRKAVKSQQYQSQILQERAPFLQDRHKALSELSQSLGEHHDLALLIGPLIETGFHDLAPLARERMRHLEKEILPGAQALFRRPARKLTAKVKAAVDATASPPSRADASLAE